MYPIKILLNSPVMCYGNDFLRLTMYLKKTKKQTPKQILLFKKNQAYFTLFYCPNIYLCMPLSIHLLSKWNNFSFVYDLIWETLSASKNVCACLSNSCYFSSLFVFYKARWQERKEVYWTKVFHWRMCNQTFSVLFSLLFFKHPKTYFHFLAIHAPEWSFSLGCPQWCLCLLPGKILSLEPTYVIFWYLSRQKILKCHYAITIPIHLVSLKPSEFLSHPQ